MPEIDSCCGTTCDKAKAMGELQEQLKTTIFTTLTLGVVSDFVDKDKLAKADLPSIEKMKRFIKVCAIQNNVPDELLTEYIKEFTDHWKNSIIIVT